MLSYLSVPFFVGLAFPVFADAAGFDFTPLVNMGAVGVILGWFLWKDEPRKRAIEAAIDRNTRSIMILLLEIQETTPRGKEMAESLIKEIDAASKKRGDE